MWSIIYDGQDPLIDPSHLVMQTFVKIHSTWWFVTYDFDRYKGEWKISNITHEEGGIKLEKGQTQIQE